MTLQLARVEWGGLSFARPWALALVVLLLAVALLARRRRRPVRRSLGTLDLLVGAEPEDAASRRALRWPLWTWLLLAGGAACAVALAGPRLALPGAAGRAEVVLALDRSWGLDAQGRFSPPAEPRRTRLAAALVAAEPWLAACAQAGLEVDWSTSDGRRLPEGLDADRRRAELLSACATADAPGRMPSGPAPWPRLVLSPRAGAPTWGDSVVRGGGSAADGAVARLGDGEVLALTGGEAAPRELALSGHVTIAPEVPADLAELTRGWAGARGLPVGGDAANAGPALLELGAFGGASAARRGGREGFDVEVRPATGASETAPAPGGDAWLQDGAGAALVLARAGRIDVVRGAWTLGGEPLAFPAAWARLLDAYVRDPPELVSASARAAAEPAVVLDLDAVAAARPAPAERSVVAWAAAAAAGLFALGGLALLRA